MQLHFEAKENEQCTRVFIARGIQLVYSTFVNYIIA